MNLCIKEIHIGDDLKNKLSIVKNTRPRFLIHELEDYLYKENNGKVCILYGLRRTGKSFMMYHSILNMSEEDFKRTALINISQINTIGELSHDLNVLEQNNFKYIFIDEVTYIEEFIATANIISDNYSIGGMKIVLSGTDSLGFIFAQNTTLYDRCEFIHTTYIPYYEYQYLLNKSIDEYIEYGGTLQKENLKEYLDSAVAYNIQNSLENYKDGRYFGHLKQAYYKNELTSSIQRFVEMKNRQFIVELIEKNFKSSDLGSAIQLYNDKNPRNVIPIDRKQQQLISKELKKTLEIKDYLELQYNLDQKGIDELKQYLNCLEFTLDLPIETFGTRIKDTVTLFVQPVMRYSQKKQLELILDNDDVFSTLDSNVKTSFKQILDNDVKGKILEEIIICNTIKSLSNIEDANLYIFQAQFDIAPTKQGEIDMVIIDRKTYKAYLFEIKHSHRRHPNQTKHLLNEEFIQTLEKIKGVKVEKKFVLYNGETCLVESIQYLNIQEYLKKLLEFNPHYLEITQEFNNEIKDFQL